MTEDMKMEDLLAQQVDAKPGSIVDGTVVSRSEKDLLIDVGLKQEASLSLNEFPQKYPDLGEKIPVLVIRLKGPDGRPLVSWKQARERKNWDHLKTSFDNKDVIEGTITNRIKGGVQVDIGLDAFMPASQIDERPVHQPEKWVGKIVQVQILEMDRTKGNVLVSRRKILEEKRAEKRAATLEKLKIDDVVKGKVTNITNFGAFIDIGGIEGLLHVSDLSWNKEDDLKKVLKVGQHIDVKILKYDTETHRISLGRKHLLPHPWDGIGEKYAKNSTVKGKVKSFASFGAFIEIEPGVEGLIHLTEMSWTDRVKSPKEKLKLGQEVEVKIIDLDPGQQKFSLSLKRLQTNPWEEFQKKHPKGSIVEGEVTHLAPFGAFIKVEFGLEGLLKTQDLSWTERIQNTEQKLKVGNKISLVLLDISPNQGKMALGLKQKEKDPLSLLTIGKAVQGKVIRVVEFGIFVKLDSGLEGLIRRADIEGKKNAMNGTTQPKIDLKDQYKEGSEITASIVKINRKERKLDLSIRRYERDQEKALLKKYSSDSSLPTLGEATGWMDDKS